MPRCWPTRCGRCTTSVLAGGGAQYVERHRARGKMMVRERLEALVDPGTPVLELCPLAGLHTGDPVGGGVVVALAEIAAHAVPRHRATTRRCAAAPRARPRSASCCAPWTWPRTTASRSSSWSSPGGADLPRQADVFVPGGEQFRRLTQLSAQGIPTVCVVFGSSTAGGAYLPGMSDYTVMVEDRARVFLGGPPLVKMAIGEEADEEELGGARMHARTSGLCDYLARDEDGRAAHRARHRGPPALAAPRSRTGRRGGRAPATRPRSCSASRRSTCASPSTCARSWPGSSTGRASRSSRSPTARSWCAAGASIGGYPIGVLANNGILFSPEAQKGAQFIALCNRTDTPILFVQNITGFMVGHAVRAGRHHQGRGQADQRRLELDGARTSRSWSGPATARATTPWPGGPTTRASSSPGPTTASR